MAKVTATDGNGNDVPVIQAQFNNLGQVESFLTQLPNGHQKWVFASEYQVEVDEAGDQPDIRPGVMTKTATIKPSEIVTNELVPPADPAEPAVPSEPVKPKMGLQDNTEPVIDDELVPADGPLDPGIISEGDLDGPVPTAPILDIPADELTPPTEPVAPVLPPPAEPATPPVKPAVSNSTAAPKPTKPTKPAAK